MSYQEKNRTQLNSQIITNLITNAALFFIVMQILPPQGISSISPTLSLLWNTLFRYFAMSLIFSAALLQILLDIKHNKMNYVPLLMGLLYPFAAAIITLFHGLELRPWWNNYSSVLFALAILLMCKNGFVRLIKVLKLYLGILCIINFLCILAYPTGMYSSIVYNQYNWFLGYKSSIQCYLLPWMVLEWIDYTYTKKRTRFYFNLFIALAESFLSRNSMLSVGMAIFFLYVVFKLYNTGIFRSIVLFFIAIILANILIVTSSVWLFSFQPLQQLLEYFGKNATLSARTTLVWPNALIMIINQPILGYGVRPAVFYVNYLGSGRGSIVHSHNQILQVLLDGGVVLFAIFILWIVYTCCQLYKERDRKSSKILVVSTFLIFLMATVEVFIYSRSYVAYWIVLFMSMYTKQIDEQYGNYLARAQKIKVVFEIPKAEALKKQWQ